jgi:plasmid stability protein
MKSLHIRDVSPRTVENLKRLARRHHRSLQGELRMILDQSARMAVDSEREKGLSLHVVRTGIDEVVGRNEIYGDDGR